MKPTPDQIIKDARKLEDRFKMRQADLRERSALRYGNYEIEIPLAYRKTSEVFKSPVIREEGRQLLALIQAQPVLHVPPPEPEMQAKTTTMEKFGSASLQELQDCYGAIDAQCASAQIHEKIGWIYLGMKRDYYADRPEDTGDIFEYTAALDAYKRSTGIDSLFEMRFVPTQTMFHTGPVWNPSRVYEIKDVDEFDLIAQYGIKVDDRGEWSMPEVTTLPSGEEPDTPQESLSASRTLKFIEYWDKSWCFLLCVNPLKGWLAKDQVFVIDSWEHNWGRVPYFARPAFETDQTEEAKKFESPLDGLYAEIKTYNRVRTILSSVSYMTGFAPLKVVTKEGNDLILDENNKPKVFLEFEPGKPTQLGVGQDVLPVIVSPEASILQNEVAASESRIIQYSLSQIAKGVSPGSDTANSALSTLRRMQRSSLQTLNANQARQYRELFKFMFERILGKTGEGIGEPVFVYSQPQSDLVRLAPEDIVTLNIQVKSDADQGQDALIEEKAALEAYQLGAITELEYHTRRGKENPEEYVKATALDRLRRSFEPELFQGIKALFGQSSALAALVAENRASGDASKAIPGILNTIQGIQDPSGDQGNGMGEGSAMMPRQEAVRSPAVQGTTQPGGGY